jgi:ABC-type uncharacterized transport system permease subunit
MLGTSVNIAVTLLYALSAALLASELWHAPSYSQIGKWRRLSPAVLGFLLHGGLMIALVLQSSGLDISFYNALSLAAFAIVLLLLLFSALKPVEMLGIGLLPIAAASVIAGELMGDSLASTPVRGELQFHVITSLLAYGVLSVGAMQAILVGIQAHLLRTHQPGGFVRALPPLNRMEELLFQLLAIGFALLSIALLSGFVYLHDMFAQHLVHKTVLSLVAWAVFGVVLLGRYVWGWRGLRAVRWTLAGLVFLLLAYFGSKFVLELLLQ